MFTTVRPIEALQNSLVTAIDSMLDSCGRLIGTNEVFIVHFASSITDAEDACSNTTSRTGIE